ncbi:hypothetical protein AB0I28_06625 [Phytomonospora sp. NPDC050363]|uniref:hypothetical protein n=1 Tax=Phytomonospora sp. NPDC050363 TaxID=3155642 RepID=UPI00340DD6EB
MGGRKRPGPWWAQAADAPLHALDGRVLTHVGGRKRALPHILSTQVSPEHGGFVLAGEHARTRLAELREEGFEAPILLDTGGYEKGVASFDAPFEYGDGLHRVPLAELLDAQLDAGATVALTPTLFVGAGDLGALVSALSATARLDRDDTVCLLPLHFGWLRPPHYATLRQALWDIRIPTALMLGAVRDPLDSWGAARRLRALVESFPGLSVLRTDLAAFDALVHGAGFASLGATSAHRHAWIPVLAGDRRMGRRPPHVYLPELFTWKDGRSLAVVFANAAAPPCSCPVCQGRRLDRFTASSDRMAHEAAAHAQFHLTGLLGEFHYVEPAYRAAWWHNRCRDSLAGYRRWSSRWRSASSLSPAPSALRFWAASSP